MPALGALAAVAIAACSPSGPTGRRPDVTSALNVSPKTSDFIFEASNSIIFHSSPLTVTGGDVGARGAGSGPFLSGGVAVDLSSGATVQKTHNVIADSIRLNSGVVVGDLQTKRLVNPSSGTHGSVTALVPLPALPAVATVTPGMRNLTVAGGKTVTASPGQFLTVSLGSSSLLRLSAGTYQMNDLTLGSSARIEALGIAKILIANRLNTGSSFYIGPASGTRLTSKDIRVEVSGVNGSDGGLSSTPKAAALGSDGSLHALVLVPNGTLSFASGICTKGAFMARDIDVGSSKVAYTFEDGFPNAAACTTQSCDDHNACTTDTCGTNGVCTHANVAAGTSCSDGNACNGAETCNGTGVCQAGTPVTCTVSDQCHSVGTCDSSTGKCTNPAKADGTVCNDSNACTRTDTCRAGACAGSSPVTCTASDQCHTVGTCDPSTGVCSTPPAMDGTACDDGNPCTRVDSCQSGTCKGSSLITCVASDQCHVAGICSPATGLCSNPAIADGTTCNDGNACTQTDVCQSGVCTGSRPVTCTASDQCHTAGSCDPTTGACSNPVVADGTSCSDGNGCTRTDTCRSGVCTGSSPVTCAAVDQCHLAGACDPATGVCSNPSRTDGAPCDDANACTHGDTCQAGTCRGGAPVICAATDSCHSGGTCDATTGACAGGHALPDGTACNDGNACTSGDACAGGSCKSGSPVVCSGGDLCHAPGTCDPSTGTCSTPTLIAACDGLPPDPATIAPPLPNGVATNVFAATQFLYTGGNPVQLDVAPGAIDPPRTALVRGRVLTRDGLPVPGVTVSQHGRPDLGFTRTRDDGRYTLVVNGGDSAVLDYERADFLAAQRHLEVGWQGSRELPDVRLVAPDPVATQVDLDTPPTPIQVVQASPNTDVWGTRRTTMLFEAGTEATAVMADGTLVPLPTPTVRATEYTVGDNGLEAMPADLPPTSAYTYAFDVTVDEAPSAKAIVLTKPVITYVENFLRFPIGSSMPLGYYNPDEGVWVPADSGLVTKIVGVDGDLAQISLSSDDSPVDPMMLTELGISDDELRTLANLYPVGRTLWRLVLPHFSHWDSNQGWGPPAGAAQSSMAPAGPNQGGCSGSAAGASVMQCQNQVLGESLPVVGTPFTLNYRSDRVVGHTASRTLDIPLTTATPPSILKRIDLEIDVGGKTYRQFFAPAPSLTYPFMWDGLDAFGRPAPGTPNVVVHLGYTYEGSYQSAPRFGYSGNGIPITGGTWAEPGAPPLDPSTPPRLGPITLWQTEDMSRPGAGELTYWDQRGGGLGGWSLSVHHSYDPVGQVLYLGTGDEVRREQVSGGVRRYFGGGGRTTADDGLKAADVGLFFGQGTVGGLLAQPDGTLVVATVAAIWQVSRGGVLTRIAGPQGGGFVGFDGDGGPARSAHMSYPQSLARMRDGSIVFADLGNNRVRRISPDGIITTVAGTGANVFAGDGGPATSASFGNVSACAVGPDDSIYVVDSSSNRIRRVTPDGLIFTIAGDGAARDSGDGGPATMASTYTPVYIAVARDGTVYFSSAANGYVTRIRKVSTDGTISTFAGGCDYWACNTNEGAPAVGTIIDGLTSLAVDAFGHVYFSQMRGGANVWRITDDGKLGLVVGGRGINLGSCPNDIPAVSPNSCLALSGALTFGPDSTMYVVDGLYYDGNRGATGVGIVSVKPTLPGFSSDVLVAPSPDGSEQYVFDSSGRHLKTKNALTQADVYTFSYDADGRLVAVIDGDGNTTKLERATDGGLKAIIAPFGQRTAVALDQRGYLASVSDPAGLVTELEHDAGGLLTKFVDPRGGTHAFAYDERGRLVQDTDPANAVQTLARTDVLDLNGGVYGVDVTRTTGEGRAISYSRVEQTTGEVNVSDVDATGVGRSDSIDVGGNEYSQLPDGTVVSTTLGPDQLTGAADTLTGWTVTTPGGLTYTRTYQRSATRDDAGQLQSVQETTNINGRQSQAAFNPASRQWTRTTMAGRTTVETVDAQGRTVMVQNGTVAPTSFEYDSAGRLVSASQASIQDTRTIAMSYDASGLMSQMTDPIGQVTTYVRDADGRIVSETLPGGRAVAMSYDANNNLVSLTPPGRSSYTFAYTPADLEASAVAPQTGSQSAATTFAYNKDRQITSITSATAGVVQMTYDDAGRLSTMATLSGGQPSGDSTTFSYDRADRLSSISNAQGVGIAYQYDGPLPVVETLSGVRPTPITLTRAFDDSFRLRSESVDGANEVDYGFDADGLMIKAGPLSLVRDLQSGLVATTSLGSVSDSRSYDSYGALSSYSASVAGVEVFRDEFTRDGLGRIVTRLETVDGAATRFDYAFGAGGHLTDVARNGQPASHYEYDANGNRVSASIAETGQTSVAGYDGQDRLTSLGATIFGYSAGGQLLTRTDGSAVTTYGYDQFDNLRRVDLPDGTTVEYNVDGRNRRVGKSINGNAVQMFAYDSQLLPLVELDGSGNIVSRFVYEPQSGVLEYMVKEGVTYRIITDHLGSPRLVIDSQSGSVAQEMDFDEWGIVTRDTNPGFQPFGFAGGILDGVGSAVRYGVRDYDPELGRWTTRDPSGVSESALNPYAYADSDPIDARDPSGLLPALLLQNSSPECDRVYSACDQYAGANARCFCHRAGNDPWSQYVRACLVNLYSSGANGNLAHHICYQWATALLGPPNPYELSSVYLECRFEQQKKCRPQCPPTLAASTGIRG